MLGRFIKISQDLMPALPLKPKNILKIKRNIFEN